MYRHLANKPPSMPCLLNLTKGILNVLAEYICFKLYQNIYLVIVTQERVISFTTYHSAFWHMHIRMDKFKSTASNSTISLRKVRTNTPPN